MSGRLRACLLKVCDKVADAEVCPALDVDWTDVVVGRREFVEEPPCEVKGVLLNFGTLLLRRVTFGGVEFLKLLPQKRGEEAPAFIFNILCPQPQARDEGSF
jgi:hypothetical protein